MTKRYPAIPDPGNTPEGVREAVKAMKQSVETLTRQRGLGRKVDAAVTWQDLVDLGLIDPTEVPTQ